MVGCFINPLFFVAEVLKFIQAEEISNPSIAFPVAVGLVVLGVIARPRELWNRINDPQKEPEDPI